MNFESATEIERKREELKQARQQYLEKAKTKYERDERRTELSKQRGEDSWMLPALSDRLEREEQSLKKSKKKKKEKKKKKQKKKEKKKKRKESSSSSDSSSDEDEGAQWVEKAAKPTAEPAGSAPLVKGPRMERDSWMEAPIDLFPTVTRKDLLQKKNKEKEEQDKAKELMEKPGMYAKELNPYWKDGGTGLPEEDATKKKAKDRANTGPGDGGLSWLRKAYQRCVEQAKEEGRSLEDLAAERWGSLKNIQKMIKEAESTVSRGSRADRPRDRFMRPDDSRTSSSTSRSFQRPRSRSRSCSPARQSREDQNRSRTSDKYSERHRDSRSRSRERRRRSSSRDRKQKRSRSRSQERKHRSRSRERHRRSRSRSRSRERYRHREGDRSPAGSGSRSGQSSLKGRFMKPGEMSESSRNSQTRKSLGGAPAWRKKEFHKPSEEEEDRHRKDDRRKDDRHRRRSSSTESSSSESSSEESSSASESEAENERSRAQQEEVKILSEKEMNDLGAKIVKAEIMGNMDQAEKLKQQLEAAREARKNAPKAAAGAGRPQGGVAEDDDGFITLTKTDRSGMARPIPDRIHPQEARGGKRRKKRKVETHTGKIGERTKYFDDDDKFDLKTMVEREKMGTAEDQNQMFARLAGRAAEKTNDDFQVDDIFLSKANQKQSDSIQEERERAQAIFEHRKMASALEKCNFCFSKVKKHLIISIGTKAYLCLPETKSLTEGHCLIVPMQHVASGTAVDEDVWSEIQVFRKCLTGMFSERGEDVVFLETSMHLKSFPHMCLHCVPMEREVGELAPIYFKKAIQESESEWSQNKKLVDLRNKDIRHAVPKGFPYFSVDFGYQGGFAHVIEDEQKFPKYFGQEIIGGMIDADHQLWRKPPRENFDDQRKKVLHFAEMWKPHDWTQNIAKKTQEDSDSD